MTSPFHTKQDHHPRPLPIERKLKNDIVIVSALAIPTAKLKLRIFGGTISKSAVVMDPIHIEHKSAMLIDTENKDYKTNQKKEWSGSRNR